MVPAWISLDRTAKPSIWALSKAGTASGEVMVLARMRPSADAVGICWAWGGGPDWARSQSMASVSVFTSDVSGPLGNVGLQQGNITAHGRDPLWQ